MVERISTGIESLDEFIQGGVPEGGAFLVSGTAGIGKTLFSCQFMWKGLQEGDKCLFITLEEETEQIKQDAAEFGWNFDKHEDFVIKYINPFSNDFTFDNQIRDYLDEIEPDRVVIDPVSIIGMGISSNAPGHVRKELYELIRELKSADVTTLMTTEKPDEESMTRYGVEEYVVDGAIIMQGLGFGGDMGRRMTIQKMRRTDFEHEVYPVKFTEDGLEVEEPEKGLSL